MQVRVYIDGFNLYYRALRKTKYKWLNPVSLISALLPDDQIDFTRYFTARVSPRAGDTDAPRRQQIYLNALATLPKFSFHYGRFLPKQKWRPVVNERWNPHVMIEVHDTEEKGSDVNLASHLLNDGFRGRYEAAIICSQDTDLCEPMRMVAHDLKKPIGLICLDGKEPNRRLRRVASFVRHVNPGRLLAAQFPDPLMGKNGHLIHKPDEWR